MSLLPHFIALGCPFVTRFTYITLDLLGGGQAPKSLHCPKSPFLLPEVSLPQQVIVGAGFLFVIIVFVLVEDRGTSLTIKMPNASAEEMPGVTYL